MSVAKRFKPNGDNAFFLERTLPDREPLPRLEASPFRLPRRVKFDPIRCLQAWRSIDYVNDLQRIIEHMAILEAWERRIGTEEK
jgi:hypothetical protein